MNQFISKLITKFLTKNIEDQLPDDHYAKKEVNFFVAIGVILGTLGIFYLFLKYS